MKSFVITGFVIVISVFIAIAFAANNVEVIYLAIPFLGGIVLYASIKGDDTEIPHIEINEHGSAEYATKEEIKRVNNTEEKSVPGLFIGGGYIRRKTGHLMTVAAARTGKGAALIIPNLLLKPSGSNVIIDPKGELACITARAQREYGQKVFILDPWNEQQEIGAKHGIPAAGFNPFDMLKMDYDHLPDNCEMIAHYLVPEKENQKDPYWDTRARSIIKNFLLYIILHRPENEHNFWTLYKMVRSSVDELRQILNDMIDSTAYDGLIRAFANEYVSSMNANETFGGIMSHVHAGTSLFESTQLRKSLLRSEFNPYMLPEGDVTLYIGIPEKYMTSHSAYLKIVIGLCLKAVNSRPKKRVNFFIDEAAILGKLDDIRHAYTFGAGQNIAMWTFWHSLAQIQEIYGSTGLNHILSSAHVKIFFSIRDMFTQEFLSKMLGNRTAIQEGYSFTDNKETTNYSKYARPLMDPEEIGKYKEFIIFTEDIKFLVKKQMYFTRENGLSQAWFEHFKAKADPPPRIH